VRSLTDRQRQVLLLAANGNTSEQAGRQLGIHRNTVDRHLGEAYRLLDARDRTHAVVLAIYHGHITLADIAAIATSQSRRQAA
jgi:DNA-binding CsgD family transcriptional regulator